MYWPFCLYYNCFLPDEIVFGTLNISLQQKFLILRKNIGFLFLSLLLMWISSNWFIFINYRLWYFLLNISSKMTSAHSLVLESSLMCQYVTSHSFQIDKKKASFNKKNLPKNILGWTTIILFNYYSFGSK